MNPSWSVEEKPVSDLAAHEPVLSPKGVQSNPPSAAGQHSVVNMAVACLLVLSRLWLAVRASDTRSLALGSWCLCVYKDTLKVEHDMLESSQARQTS